MPKSAMVRARIEPSLKENVEDIFQKLGISATEAITLFYSQIKLRNGIPFKIEIPNEITKNTFKNTDNNIQIKSFKDKNDMFKDLEI